MKVYFYKYEITKYLCQYKRNWINQIFNSIETYSKKITITTNILETNIIFSIVDFVEQIEKELDLEKLNIKLIIISCQDPVTIIKKIIKNPNVIYIFDHLKLISVPDYFLLSNNSYSHSKYLLHKYYKTLSNDIVFDEDIKFKKLYMEKTKCILNTSNIYSRIFDKNSSHISTRKYDITYIAHLDYSDVITSHRKDIVNILYSIGKKHNLNVYLGKNNNGSKLPLHKYYRILKNTKIFVSPWGWGEWSLKEFECICFGTQCLIPNKHLYNYPNFNENFDEYLLDHTNLESKILELLGDLDKTQKKIDLNRKLFLEYSNEKQINLIEELIFNLDKNNME